jgi:hypothetical protein
MYDNLNALGISHPEVIDRYSLLQEGDIDILKIYFQKTKGEIFAKSVKCKFPAGQRDPQTGHSSLDPKLEAILAELNHVAEPRHIQIELQQKILNDLRHLEQVVANKIAEIEADLRRLPLK